MSFSLQGAGYGLRRSMLRELDAMTTPGAEFLEIAPENWMEVGGRLGRKLRQLTEKRPFICHGLSLNIGGFAPLDEVFLKKLKQFNATHQIRWYSEHLSYCGDEGHLYDLLPIPFTEETVRHVATRIARVQEVLGQRIAMENVSYYADPGREMNEAEFVNAVVAEADCDLLLDINNIYVNSVNHRYDAREFLAAMPAERIAYLHIAGHYNEAEDLIVDTHGAEVIDPVWALLDEAYAKFGVFPTLLERDFNIPPIPKILREVDQIRAAQSRVQSPSEPLRAVG